MALLLLVAPVAMNAGSTVAPFLHRYERHIARAALAARNVFSSATWYTYRHERWQHTVTHDQLKFRSDAATAAGATWRCRRYVAPSAHVKFSATWRYRRRCHVALPVPRGAVGTTWCSNRCQRSQRSIRRVTIDKTVFLIDDYSSIKYPNIYLSQCYIKRLRIL